MIKHIEEYEDIRYQSTTTQWRWMVFKHSDTCPTSTNAHRQVEQFLEKHPEVPVLMLEVKAQRPLSMLIAEKLETQHESPQILIFKGKVLKEVKNHLAISDRGLTHLVQGGYAN